MWYDPIVTVFLGTFMLFPLFNIALGAMVWGWAGFWTGVILTMLSVLTVD
jgi:hypothetical protein